MRYGLNFAPHLFPISFRDYEVAMLRDKRAHFLRHATAELGIARAECDHRDVRPFAEKPPQPALHRGAFTRTQHRARREAE